MALRPTQLDNIHKDRQSELSSHIGSDPECNPPHWWTVSLSSDEDLKSPDKGSSCEKLPSDDFKGPDTNSREDQQRGKCTIQKRKNTRTYQKRKEKQKLNKTENVKTTVTIKSCTRREDCRQRHYCLYCGQSNLSMARHLQRKHMEIKDVAYAFSFPLGSKERKVLLQVLRNKGNFKHNSKVLEKSRGQLVTWKQPSDKASSIQDYLPCPYCYGMFANKDLWRHHSSCRNKKSGVKDDTQKTRRRAQSLDGSLLLLAASSSGCQDVIDNMRRDDVSFYIRSDSLICRYGESLYAKHGRMKSRHQYVAKRMRDLGRFMLVAKDMDETVTGLQDVCTPSKYQLVINVAKRLTEFSPGKKEYGKPSKAIKIGFCLKGAVEVLIGQTLMNDDDQAEKAKKFLELLEKNWKNHVSVSAHQTIQEKRRNTQDDITLTKDVMTLRNHLRMVEDGAKGELTQQPCLTAYKTLNETVLAQLIVFNKRHEREASRLTLETYKTANTNPINEDIYETLSPLENELSKLLTHIEVQGKRGTKVPVFLTERMKDSIVLLIERRDDAGIPAENPYLFARPGAMTNIRGCDCLRKYAEESKAENPKLLRSTKLRKQVATLCQLLDLSEQELEQVARFMGHDISVHHDFNRQTDKTFLIAKISKLLFAMEQGTGTLKEKNHNTIDLSVCDQSPGRRLLPKKRKLKKAVEEKTQSPGRTLLSKKRKLNKAVEVKNPTSTSESVPPRGKRGREDDEGEGSDLSPTQRPDPCAEKKSSVTDDQSPGRRLPPKKRKLKKAVEEKIESSTSTSESVPHRGKGVREDDAHQSPGRRLPPKKKTKLKKEVEEKKPRKVKGKRWWSEAEKNAVQKHLGNFIAEQKVPGKKDCMQCIQKEKALVQRSWRNVKSFVTNTIVALNISGASHSQVLRSQ